MIRELADGIQWISQCYEDGDRHMHLSQYVVGTDRRVLVDAGTDHRRGRSVEEIEEALEGDRLEAVLLTHSILPHTENLPRIQAEWPDVDVLAATNAPAIVGLPDEAEPKVLNDRRTVVGQPFSFLDPLLTDVVGSNWLLHEPTGTLFTAEGVGHYHLAGACADRSGDFADGISFEAVHGFHRDKLAFLGYLDPEKLRGGFESVLGEFDVEHVAPMHGNPIEAGDVDAYVDTVIESVETFREEWTPAQPVPPA